MERKAVAQVVPSGVPGAPGFTRRTAALAGKQRDERAAQAARRGSEQGPRVTMKDGWCCTMVSCPAIIAKWERDGSSRYTMPAPAERPGLSGSKN
jgi:hypothetical protein